MNKTINTTAKTKTTNRTVKRGKVDPGFRYLGEGVKVSNDSRATGQNLNDCILGTSGNGKTGSYVVPLLANPFGSLVVSDTKNRLKGLFEESLKKKGYKIETIDFVNTDNSDGYNLLQHIGRLEDGTVIEKDIKQLASNIIPPQDDKEPFWQLSAARYVSVLLAYVVESLPPKEQTMKSVCEFHNEFLGGSGKALLDTWAYENPKSITAKIYKQIGNTQQSDKMWGSIYEFANQGLEPFMYREYEKIFSVSHSYEFARLGRERTVLFINTSDNSSCFDIFTNILHTQLLQTLIREADSKDSGQLDVPVRIVLDDFAGSAKIEDFPRIISIIRSRNISVSVILQSMSQLDAMYGHANASTIMNNCSNILFMGSNDLDTAHYISEHTNKTIHNTLELERGHAILISSGTKAREIQMIKPYSMLPAEGDENELSVGDIGHEPDITE